MLGLLGLIMVAAGGLILAMLLLRWARTLTPAAALTVGGVLFLLGLIVSIATGGPHAA